MVCVMQVRLHKMIETQWKYLLRSARLRWGSLLARKNDRIRLANNEIKTEEHVLFLGRFSCDAHGGAFHKDIWMVSCCCG